MSVLEWILLGFFALGTVGGLKFIADGGYSTTRGERLFGVILNGALLVALILTTGLTWFGWALLFLAAYSVASGATKYVRFPEGTFTSRKATVVETLFSLTYLILLLAVGVN